MKIEYRKIRKEDNEQVRFVIRTSLEEFGGKRPGTAYYDEELDNMFEAYNKPRAAYFVAVADGKVVGTGGIQHLNGTDENICELQKVYLLKKYRGHGIGRHIVELCIQKAQKFGYDAIYLETFPNMKSAQKLYLKLGFEFIDHSIGHTGHNTNEIWMLKKLK